MSNSKDTSGTHFLAHPEIEQFFESVFSTLVVESDRGAVLIGAAHVDLHLKMLFEAVAPRSMSRKKLSHILGYPGALSSFSAKNDIAYLIRLIPRDVHDAINHLRGIRNAVAHSPDSFRLADHEQQLRQMYELGPGLPAAINRWACEAILHTALKNVLNVKDPLSEEGEPAFASPQTALDFMSEHPELVTALDEKRPRYELALGIALVCGLIIFHREKAEKVLGDNNVLASLMRQGEPAPQIDGK